MLEYNKKNVLIIGADSNIGSNLATFLDTKGYSVWQTTRHLNAVSGQRIFLDLSKDLTYWSPPPVTFCTVYLFAAVTSIERCRIYPESSRLINVTNTVLLAEKFSAFGAFVVFLSSNAVFDGEIPFAKIGNPINPQNEYGRQKAEVEKILLALQKNICVVRLGKVIFSNMPLLTDWVNKLRSNEKIFPFSDMFMAPVSMSFALCALHKIAKNNLNGIVQVTAFDDISYAEAAYYISERINCRPDLVNPISYKNSGISFSAKYTALDCKGLAQIGLACPTAKAAIDDFLIKFL